MRLINADALKEIMCAECDNKHLCADKPACDTVREIDSMPSIEAQPVVRCNDCKYYLNSNEKCALVDTRLKFYETNKMWTEESYCVWAERKNEVDK